MRCTMGRVRIREARQEDEAFVAGLATLFSALGSYEEILPSWFRLPGVHTFISENAQARTGCVMVAFFHEEEGLVGDVLAIAVAPEWQGLGVGRTLLEHAVEFCEWMAERAPVRRVRLSVASTNARARSLFHGCGFVEREGDHGVYEGGQQALLLERPIVSATSG